MARPATLRVDIIGNATSANRALDSAGSNLGKFARVAAAASAAAAAALGTVGYASIQAASAVEQSMGGVASVFGAHAGAVEANARAAARAVGLSVAEYGNLANVLGSQLKNAGTAANELAPATDRLIGLGADLAATFGGTTADAVSAVSSLLKGERDPIERYGVSIKAADISARLTAQGLGHLTGAARTAAEGQAALTLLTEQTAAAQGQFGRESDTTAGRLAILSATTENLKARFGEALLPAVTAVAGFLLDRFLPATERAGAAFRERFGPTLTAVAGFVTDRVIPAARALHEWFVTRIAPGLRGTVSPVVANLTVAFTRVAAAVQRNEPALRELGNAARVVVEFLATRVAPVVGGVVGFAFRQLGNAITVVLNVFGAIDRAGDRLAATLGRVKRAISGVEAPAALRTVAGWFTGSAGPVVAAAALAAREPAGVSAAAGPDTRVLGGLTLRGGDVHVYVDGAAVRSVVRRELDRWDRATARRVAAGVLA